MSLLRQESLHYISTSYLIGFIVINPTGISTLYLYTSYLISCIVIIPTGISTYYLIGFIVINPTGISTLYLYFISHQIYCNYSDRDLYTTSLLLISSILLSSIRQGSLHYISTSYLIGFIVINPTGISTLYLYFLSHQFYCHQSDRDLYNISLLLISSVLLSLFRQESQHYISTSYLIGFIVINPTGISTLYLYLLSYRFYHHVSHHISSELSSSHITCLVVY